MGRTIDLMTLEIRRLETIQQNPFTYGPWGLQVDVKIAVAQKKMVLLRNLIPGENGRNNLHIPCEDVLNAKIAFYLDKYVTTGQMRYDTSVWQDYTDLRDSLTGRIGEGMPATPVDNSLIPISRRPSFSSDNVPSNSRYNSSKTFEEISPQNQNINPSIEDEDYSPLPFKGENGDYSPFPFKEEYLNMSVVEEYLNMSVEDYLNMSVEELGAHLCNLYSALPWPIVGLFLFIALGWISIIIKFLVITIKYKKERKSKKK